MSIRVAALFVVALVIAATTFVFSQTRSGQPQVVSGNDVGFRIEGTDFRGRPVGTWVIRINGNWVEVGTAGGVHPATK
jgi:hypothetical protein